MNELNPKNLTVGDILRLVVKNNLIALTHQVENNRTHINSTITEEGEKDDIVERIGWKQLDKMVVCKLTSDETDIPTLHITYETEVIW